jgi:hypothetical protein
MMGLGAAASLVPSAAVKILFLCAVVVYGTTKIKLNSSQVTAGLMVLFALGYLVSPYWLAVVFGQKNQWTGIIGQKSAMAIFAALLMAVGIAWSRVVSGDIHLLRNSQDKNLSHFTWSAAMAIVILAINFMPIGYNIPVQGDEEWHIWRTATLHNSIYTFFADGKAIWGPVLIAAVSIFISLIRGLKASMKAMIIITLITGAIIFSGIFQSKTIAYQLLRYPFISSWLHQVGPVWQGSMYDEAVYRIIPVVSIFTIAYFAFVALKENGLKPLAAAMVAVGLVTVPNLYYHASILYLELPALAGLTVALYYIERLVKEDFTVVRSCGGWYALLAASFLKETLVAALAAIVVLRIVYRFSSMVRNKQLGARAIGDEILLCAGVCIPVGIYVVIRCVFADVRGYHPEFAQIGNFKLWIAGLSFLWKQFGLLVVASVAGLIIETARRRFLLVISLTAIFASDFIFHLLDNAAYVGLARFNLFLFAPMAILGLKAIMYLHGRSPSTVYATAAILIGTNLAMSPVALGGEKKPSWASESAIICEYYFPKDEAVRWLRENRPDARLVVAGAYADTKIIWYFIKEQYRPIGFKELTANTKLSWEENLRQSLETARALGGKQVLFFKMQELTGTTREDMEIEGFRLVKTFRNKYLAILLYEMVTK